MTTLLTSLTWKRIAIGLLAIAAAAMLWTGGDRDSTDTQPVAHSADQSSDSARQNLRVTAKMSHLQAQDSALASELDELRTQVEELSTGEAGAAAPAGEPEALTHEEMEARAADMLQAQMGLFEEQMSSESVDHGWASDAVASLHQAFSAEHLRGVNLDHAECLSTVCRLDFRFDSAENRDIDFRMALNEMPWQSEAFFHVNGEGLDAQVFLAREGHSLPRAELEPQGS
ncbi:MAG: hypothetical protein AAGC55_02495 [Myxococcota bacterium]